MNHVRVLYHMVRADFLERVRRYSFLLTLTFSLYLAYETAVGNIVLRLDEYRGVFNSAWLGSMMTLVSTAFLTLVGFYVVKNAILRDEQTRVGRILASTPMSRAFYTLAKTASNFFVLGSMLGVLALAAVVMQFKFAEDPHLRLGTLLAPFVWVGLPAMAVVAAIAVLFETLPVLRGGVGNVIYFFVWGIGLGVGADSHFDDLVGFNVIGRNMQSTLQALYPAYKNGISLTVASASEGQARTIFLWPGVDWSGPVILHRMIWVGVAVGLALLASIFFHRFDPAREAWIWKRNAKLPIQISVAVPLMPPSNDSGHAVAGHLTPIRVSAGQSGTIRLVGSELRLMLKGLYWWWYVVAAGLFVACMAAPINSARGGVFLVAWLWPVLVWSQMGSRETRHSTQSLIFSSPRTLYRQLPASWAAGVIVAMLTGAGMEIRLVLRGDWEGLAAWLAGALFIPSLALALGVWSGTSKPFEAIYTVWWYIGPAHHDPVLDFMGVSAGSSHAGAYAAAAAALLVVAYLGRRSRLAYA